MTNRLPLALLLLVALASCSSSQPKLPYPAFVDTDLLQDVFMASLPGVRAKQLAGDPQTRRTSNRIDLPPGWNGTSGSAPGRSLEIFVLAGELEIADIVLTRGGYAYLPSGSLGFNMVSADGARILWFVNDADSKAMIRSPIIIDSGVLPWVEAAHSGIASKELRSDPGNGSKTWLVKYARSTSRPWESSTALREGYLVVGSFQDSECVNGEPNTWEYSSNGYFYRPAGTMSGGPESLAITESVWLLRETSQGETEFWSECIVAEPVDPMVDDVFDRPEDDVFK